MNERARAEAMTKPTDDEIDEALAVWTYIRRLHAELHERLSLADVEIARTLQQQGERDTDRREAPLFFNCPQCDARSLWRGVRSSYFDGAVCSSCYARRLR